MKKLYARYNHPSGQDHDVKLFLKAEQMNFLKRGQLYQVEKLKMMAFSTQVDLVGVPAPYTHLNSVAFDFYISKNGQFEPHNIFEDPEFNHSLEK